MQFVGGERAEATLVPDAGYELHRLRLAPLPRGRRPLPVIRAVATDAAAVRDARALVRRLSPAAVLGGGGYVAGPISLAAATASCQTLAMAIEEANSTSPDAVRKVLHERTFDTFYGPIHYGASGQNDVNAALVMQIQDNKLLVLAPEKLKQGELKIGVPKK